MFEIIKNSTILAFTSLLFISPFYAMEDQNFQGLADQYRAFLGLRPNVEEQFETPMAAFKGLAEDVRNHPKGEIFHAHIKTGPAYGRSFTDKNRHVLDYVFKILTGRVKQWPKDMILSGKGDIQIADVGSGLGLSAVYLLSQVIDVYEKEGWELKKPIVVDLFDIKTEHMPALSAFAGLVNMAYPHYFKVSASVQDVTEQFPFQNKYRIILALNMMHYIPSDKWALAFSNMRGVMRPNGVLFLVSDHYCTSGINAKERNALATPAKSQKFYSPIFTLYSTKHGVECGPHIMNWKGVNYLKKDESYVPGKTYGKDNIDADLLFQILSDHATLLNKRTISLPNDMAVKAETPLDQIMSRFSSGELVVCAGCFAFDDETLNRDIFSVLDPSNPGFKRLNLTWTSQSVKQNISSSITLTSVVD